MYICKECLVEKNPIEFRIHKKGYRIGKCKNCEREYQRKFYKEGGEITRERKRLYMKKMREENPQAIRDYQNSLRAKNPEKAREKMRSYTGKRFFWVKAMKLKGENKASTKQIASMWKKQRGLCALTGKKLDRTAQLDHILPRAKGGTDNIKNLQWLSPEVNIAKRDLTDEQFIDLCASVMAWIGKRIQMVENMQKDNMQVA